MPPTQNMPDMIKRLDKNEQLFYSGLMAGWQAGRSSSNPQGISYLLPAVTVTTPYELSQTG
jgi:hypothetical protein